MSGSSVFIFCISLLGKRVLVFVVLKRNPSKGGEMFRRFSLGSSSNQRKVSAVKMCIIYRGRLSSESKFKVNKLSYMYKFKDH